LTRFLPVAQPDLSEVEERYLLDAFRSGWISSLGPYVDRFEREFADFCNVEHAVAVANGTVALDLALLAAGVGPGDEVIIPSHTFVATAAAVKHVGAEPVFVDGEDETATLDPSLLRAAVSHRTKAVIPVHLYGHPADMDPINDFAEKHNLVVIEDAAEAHGALYRGRPVGSIGHMATFSFYGNKIITTGEGGMIVTSDEHIATRIRFLKDHAMDPLRRYWHPEVGFNYRMTNLQAAIGCAQLSRVREIMQTRRLVVNEYAKAFEGSVIRLPRLRDWAQPVPWLVCVMTPLATRSAQSELIVRLRKHGIDSRPYFHDLTTMPPYASSRRYTADGTSVAEGIALSAINLPSAPSVAVHEVRDVARIVVQEVQSLLATK
jgi:perosamine synthetase